MYRYPSIINAKKLRCDDSIKTYFVSEKMHGANFSFILEKDGIKVASRNQLLGDLDGITFFSSGDLIRKKVKALYKSNLYKEFCSNEKVEKVIIYGELYGDKVFKNTGYNKSSDFIAFDMLVFLKGDVNFFVNYEMFKHKVSEVFDVVSAIQIGNLETLINRCSKEENFEINRFLEGFVIKSYETRRVEERVYKVISPKFSKRKTTKEKVVIDKELNEQHLKYLELINAERVESAISKLGQVGFSEVLNEVLSDAEKDFIEDGGVYEDRKSFFTPMMPTILPIVRETWLANR